MKAILGRPVLRRLAALGAAGAVLLGLGGGLASAQTTVPTPVPTPRYGTTVEIRFAGTIIDVGSSGRRLEALPVLALIGAEAGFSPAAGTYGVVLDEHFIQLAPGRKHVLIDGTLQEFDDAPQASPGGVSVTVSFLEKALLSPLGYHLEAIPGGYRIATGARFADPVAVRAAAADFASTTTLVLTLNRPVEAEVSPMIGIGARVQFVDAAPQVDPSMPLRSRRVQGLEQRGQQLLVELASGVGLLTWHTLEDPPRIILEVGRVEPTPTPRSVEPVVAVRNPPVVIDPGHGGDDIGAQTPDGIMEKDLVLAVARHLRDVLAGRGHVVRLTRNGDQNRALSDRTAMANRLEAKVFISLHANASTVSSVRGAETYYMSLDKEATDAAAAATADLENRALEGSSGGSAIELILWDLAQSEVLNDSARLALVTQTRLNSLLGLKDRGVKQAPFAVLTGATMPAVLVEVGFLSNQSEAARLAEPEHQRRLAEAIALGIEDFLSQP